METRPETRAHCSLRNIALYRGEWRFADYRFACAGVAIEKPLASARRRADQEGGRRRAEGNRLTLSDAFRLMILEIATKKTLPFEPLLRNPETIEAMKAARRGELTTVGPPGKLLPSLNAS
jgi:RelB antitoxin